MTEPSGGRNRVGVALLSGRGWKLRKASSRYPLSRYFGLIAFVAAYGYAFGAFVLGARLELCRWERDLISRGHRRCRWRDFFWRCPAGPMTRRGQYRNTATYGRNEHAVEASQAENPDNFREYLSRALGTRRSPRRKGRSS